MKAKKKSPQIENLSKGLILLEPAMGVEPATY